MQLLTSQCFFLTLITVYFICSITFQYLSPLFFIFVFIFIFLNLLAPILILYSLATMFNSIFGVELQFFPQSPKVRFWAISRFFYILKQFGYCHYFKCVYSVNRYFILSDINFLIMTSFPCDAVTKNKYGILFTLVKIVTALS